jgi:hypothetical protein
MLACARRYIGGLKAGSPDFGPANGMLAFALAEARQGPGALDLAMRTLHRDDTDMWAMMAATRAYDLQSMRNDGDIFVGDTAVRVRGWVVGWWRWRCGGGGGGCGGGSGGGGVCVCVWGGG